MTNVKKNRFYLTLFRKTMLPVLVVFGVGLLYIILMSIIDHRSYIVPYVILILALVKTTIVSRATLKQLSKLVEACY